MEVDMAEEVKKDDKAPETKTDLKSEALSATNKLEAWLDGINKQLPQIPKKGRDVIAQITPWLALAGGVLSLLSLWWMWQAGHAVNSLVKWSNDFARTYGGTVVDTTPNLGITWYVAFALVIVQAILLLVAFPKLKGGKKAGWNLLFYNALLAALIGLAYLFTPAYGLTSFFGSLIGTAISLYLLFQIRDHFAKK